jgi:hypothetical protein
MRSGLMAKQGWSPDWDVVSAALAGDVQLYKRGERVVTEMNEETGEETSRTVVSYQEVDLAQAKAAFANIERDIERLIQEFNSMQIAERELRNALEADLDGGGAQFRGR